MKKYLLVFLLLAGCSSVRKLDSLEKALYETDTVYVEMEKKELYEKLMISDEDYGDFIAVKTLIVWNGKEVFVFENASENLMKKLDIYGGESGKIMNIGIFSVYMSEENQEMADLITKYLNEMS